MSAPYWGVLVFSSLITLVVAWLKANDDDSAEPEALAASRARHPSSNRPRQGSCGLCGCGWTYTKPDGSKAARALHNEKYCTFAREAA